jgi:superfamily II DNA/RNA helicase
MVFVLHKLEAKALAKHLNAAIGDASSDDDDVDDDDVENSDKDDTDGEEAGQRLGSGSADASYAVCLHGDMSTSARTAALDAFRTGACSVLVCTDVAARCVRALRIRFLVSVKTTYRPSIDAAVIFFW